MKKAKLKLRDLEVKSFRTEEPIKDERKEIKGGLNLFAGKKRWNINYYTVTIKNYYQ